MPISEEFLCFQGILQNLILAGDIGNKYDKFWSSSGCCARFHHEIHDCQSGFGGKNIENIKLSLSDILPVYLVDRVLQLPEINTPYLVGFKGHRKQDS